MTKSIVPIILGLVAIVLLAITLFLMVDAIMEGVFWEYPRTALYFLVSRISFPLLIVGLILMIKQRLLYKGGVIVLFAGIAPLVMFFLAGGIFLFLTEEPYALSSMLSSILAIISGSLAIKKSEEHKRDYRGLIIPITSFFFAIVPAFVFIYHYVHRILDPYMGGIRVLEHDVGGPMFVFSVLIPLSIIATVLNVISMFKVRKETNPKAKIIAKILIGLTWTIIAIFVVLFFIWL